MKLWQTHRKQCIAGIAALLIVLVVGLLFVLRNNSGSAMTTPSDNLLANPSFEKLNAKGLPAKWDIVRENGSPAVSVSAEAGYQGDHSLAVEVSQYTQGTVRIVGQKVAVHGGDRYLFSAAYRARSSFDLVAYLSYANGVEKRQIVGQYKASTKWTTMRAAIVATDDLAAVAYGVQLSTDTRLDLDAAYIVKDHTAPPAAQCDQNANLIPNAGLQTVAGAWPQGWEPFQYGDNKAVNQLRDDDHNIYAVSTITSRKDGQAKWVFLPVAIREQMRYCFAFDYNATVTTDVMARFILKDGSVQYRYLGTARPSGNWTHYTAFVNIPARVVSVQIAPELIRVGSISTDNYVLAAAK